MIKQAMATQSRSLNILMLEDNSDDVQLVLHELKKANIEFRGQLATDKQSFTQALDSFRPDVILADFALPHFTGLEAFVLTREHNLFVPFLLVTGALPEATVIEIMKAGIDDYILKDNLSRLPGALQNAYEKRSAEQRNEEANLLRKKFVTIMAHQLRTPLTVVSWNVESVLKQKSGLNAEQIQNLQAAYDANQKLTSRIDDLLTVIQIQEGDMDFEKTKASIEELWKPVSDWLQVAAAAKQLEYSYSPPPQALPSLNIDPKKISLVLQKLAENAAAYTTRGHIAASLTAADKAVRFQITDTGIGIPEADKSHIFTPFYRASNASAAQPDASGVGLNIAKYCIEQQGGTIGFSSQDGQGSTFWFTLPA